MLSPCRFASALAAILERYWTPDGGLIHVLAIDSRFHFLARSASEGGTCRDEACHPSRALRAKKPCVFLGLGQATGSCNPSPVLRVGCTYFHHPISHGITRGFSMLE